jgi:arylsulfatase A-like enzyme
MRRASRQTAGFLAAVLLAGAGCGKSSPSDWRVSFDPEIVDREPGSFHQSFDGPSSKLVLGTGWYGLEHVEKTGPWSGFSWAASAATVYFAAPSSSEVDLAARCAPFAYAGAAPQTMTPFLNGTALPAVALAADWHEVRVPLPSQLLRRPINTLELRFAHTAQPSRVIGSGDPRELSAAFDQLAVLPRGRVLDAPASRMEGDGARRSVTLRSEGLAIPLPAAQRYRERFGAVQPSKSGLQVALELWSGDGSRREIRRGAADRLSNRSIDFQASGRGASMLLLRLEGEHGGPPSPSATVSLELSAPEVLQPLPPAPGGARPPDIFLYLIDTLRADALGAYGSKLGLTPRIDAFAREAIAYERATAPSSWTLPSTVSILSGVYPFEHGMIETGDSLPAGAPWLPEELAKAGYETAAFSQWPLGRSFGVQRGFGNYYLDVRLAKKSYSELARGLFWQHDFGREDPRRPLFAYVHVSDPHAVYDPTGEDRALADRSPGTLPPQLYNTQIFLAEGYGKNAADTAHLRALYEGEVRHADRQFGAFLDLLRYLGRYDQSLVILVSDHGEEFYEHGGFDHGRTLYEELLHVPLIVKLPGEQTGLRISQRVSTLDLTPTILMLLGRSFGELRLHGKPLPMTAGGPAAAERPLFSQVRVGASATQGAVDLAAVTAGQIKCVHSALKVDRFGKPASSFQIFDLSADPGERTPLAESDSGSAACREELGRWLSRAQEGEKARDQRQRQLPPEEIQRLRALGYLR